MLFFDFWLSNYPTYFIVLLFCFVSLIIGIIFQTLGFLIAPLNVDLEKQSSYECGFDPFGDARSVFDISFYKTSILFLLFDLELAYIAPFVASNFDWYGFYVFIIFILILLFGFVFEWNIAALDWN